MPLVFAIRFPVSETLRIAIVDGIAEPVHGVLIDLVVAPAAKVAVARSRIEVRIVLVVMVSLVLDTLVLLTRTLLIILLKAVLRIALLML